MNYLAEAVEALKKLDEEAFKLDNAGIEELAEFEDNQPDADDIIDIIDPETEEEEDLAESYIGKVILDCTVCHSKIYEDADNIEYVEGEDLVNEGHECPYCFTTDGFKIIGQVTPFTKVDETTVTDKETPEEDKVTVDETEEQLTESVGSDLAKFQALVDHDMIEYGDITKETNERLRKAGLEVVKDEYDNYEVIAKEDDGKVITEETNIAKLNRAFPYLNLPDNVPTTDSTKTKKDATPVAVKPRGGETNSDKLKRTFPELRDEDDDKLEESVNVDADEHKVTVETDDETVTVEKKCDDCDETITPPTEETVKDIQDNEDDDFVDVDMEDFDEESFDELGEKYMKKVYENVSSYKTKSVKSDKESIIVEGIITFNSGSKKPTTFKFTPKDVAKNGKCRFIGENANISRGKKAFVISGKVTEGKFLAESMTYNYRIKKKDKTSAHVYGTVSKR